MPAIGRRAGLEVTHQNGDTAGSTAAELYWGEQAPRKGLPTALFLRRSQEPSGKHPPVGHTGLKTMMVVMMMMTISSSSIYLFIQ